MSAIKKAAEMLRREAESIKECHTVGVGGEWYGESAKTEYEKMIAAAAAAVAERDELLVALRNRRKRPVQPVFCRPCRPRSNRPRHRRAAITPTEVITTLRQFNAWRRGHHDEQPDPRVRAILAWTVRGQWNGAT